MYVWSLIRDWQNDTFEVELLDVPLKNQVSMELMDWVCSKTGHAFCGQQESLWRIPLGLARDEDGYWSRSVGSLFFDLYQKASRLVYGAHEPLQRLLIDHDTAAEILPEWVANLEEFEDDTDRGKDSAV